MLIYTRANNNRCIVTYLLCLEILNCTVGCCTVPYCALRYWTELYCRLLYATWQIFRNNRVVLRRATCMSIMNCVYSRAARGRLCRHLFDLVTVTVIILWCYQLMNPSVVEVRSLSEYLWRSVFLRYCSSDTLCPDHKTEQQIRQSDTACTRYTKSNLSQFSRFVCEMYKKEISALFTLYKETRRWKDNLTFASPCIIIQFK